MYTLKRLACTKLWLDFFNELIIISFCLLTYNFCTEFFKDCILFQFLATLFHYWSTGNSRLLLVLHGGKGSNCFVIELAIYYISRKCHTYIHVLLIYILLTYELTLEASMIVNTVFGLDRSLILLYDCVNCIHRPLSASVLAVGCNTGIFIWTVDPTSPVTR